MIYQFLLSFFFSQTKKIVIRNVYNHKVDLVLLMILITVGIELRCLVEKIRTWMSKLRPKINDVLAKTPLSFYGARS